MVAKHTQDLVIEVEVATEDMPTIELPEAFVVLLRKPIASNPRDVITVSSHAILLCLYLITSGHLVGD